MSNTIDAIGFDLFNTLVVASSGMLPEANARLVRSLRGSGFSIREPDYYQAHLKAAVRHLEKSRQDGRETHNRYWISSALEAEGFQVPPDDPRVSKAVEAYFSSFYDHCSLIPGTLDMLHTLQGHYRLGLLSNFTHGPAARLIIERLGLEPCFETILISGELGYRKPHPMVFETLIRHLDSPNNRTLYIGDDPEPDIEGALGAGLLPVWTTYVLDHGLYASAGILAKGTPSPPLDVPRVRDWKDLLSLLDHTRVPGRAKRGT